MAIKQLLLRLPEDTYKDLKIRAIQEGKRVSQLALEWFQEKLGKPFHSGSPASQNDDPVVRELLAPPKTKFPSRDFTDEEINAMMKNQEREEKENPELLEWARKKAKAQSK